METIRRMLSLSASQSSLDTTASEHNSVSLKDKLACPSNIDPADLVSDDNLRSQMESWLQQLEQPQREVIKRRFGLFGRERATLELIAKDTGMTREKVRTLQVSGIAKLRQLMSGEGLAKEDF